MEPLRFPTNRLPLRARVFNLIRERSFRRGEYVLASGKKSNYYLDLKPTMFHPEGIMLLGELIYERIDQLNADFVGGLEMGAIPLITAVNVVSNQKGRPVSGFVVRKNVKDHGTKKLIEGASEFGGKSVVILDDVATTGGSTMDAVKALRNAGANVLLVLSVVDRGEGAAEFYKNANVRFDWLFTSNEFLSA